MSSDAAPDRQDPLRFYLDKAAPSVWSSLVAWRQDVDAAAAQAGLGPQTVELVCLRVSQLNGCAFCLDTHLRSAAKAGVSEQRLALLPAWREAESVYSEQEQAALELAEALTRLEGHEQLQVAQLLSHPRLSDDQYAAVQWLTVLMNATNRISMASHHPVRPREAEARG
ncbi:carboxymuconolactone decarboxylase family protein [uncultured Micrococcus sp.]|uniref:carboxymuconolactone decarboxylase family protein n=1 Tax=uncultured Micrococcus sp. TaxID=114051 RepID=UPI002594F0D1|nr:carboxymuconolactone decarboxylase family protein [uncultured Micrococcus sp.]